jgi:hypothetical protein
MSGKEWNEVFVFVNLEMKGAIRNLLFFETSLTLGRQLPCTYVSGMLLGWTSRISQEQPGISGRSLSSVMRCGLEAWHHKLLRCDRASRKWQPRLFIPFMINCLDCFVSPRVDSGASVHSTSHDVGFLSMYWFPAPTNDRAMSCSKSHIMKCRVHWGTWNDQYTVMGWFSLYRLSLFRFNVEILVSATSWNVSLHSFRQHTLAPWFVRLRDRIFSCQKTKLAWIFISVLIALYSKWIGILCKISFYATV